MRKWDAVVIGGGLAGSAAAMRLAQKGQQVLLLEKEATAHDKVCGEFISTEAQYYLRELGLDLAALNAERITNIRLICGQKIVSARLPFPAVSLSRHVLDEAMLLRAQDHGVQIWRGVSAAAIVQDSECWRVTVGGDDVVLADTVFLATGKHDLRGWRRDGGVQNDLIGFKMHFQLTSVQQAALAEHVEMTLFDGGYAGLEQVEGAKANLCLVVSKRHLAMCGKNWDELLRSILKATPHLAERLAGSKPCWQRPLSIFGIPYGFVYPAPASAAPRLYRLGDQMAVIPSFSGNGMSIALYTAFLAVECHLHGDVTMYHHQARSDLLPLIRHASWLSKMAEYPVVQKGMVLACRLRPELITIIATQNRISEPAMASQRRND